jgi:addiction module RelE/StbE family toxin
MKLIWSPRSENELTAIVAYIAEDNIDAALTLDSHITSSAEHLLDYPKKGKPGRVEGTRELIVHEHYILVYEIAGDELQILSVLHTSRQWPPEYTA